MSNKLAVWEYILSEKGIEDISFFWNIERQIIQKTRLDVEIKPKTLHELDKIYDGSQG